MVGLLPLGGPTTLREAGTLGDSLILATLTISSVITVALFAIKGTLDQLPDVLNSWRRAVQAMRGHAERRQGEDEPASHDDRRAADR
ncbi:hypothetical protein [Streptomyces sp. enrichment culture]|uniref:hypothetical protein n=1 Tax=Streptomyces sp. enrichment culture TaxID=1795815 RepID=UPI003F55B602